MPSIGEHDVEVAAELAAGAWHRATSSATATTPGRPLAGLRVVDLTSWWVGALTTQILGRLGADVVHIEGPDNPDGMRLTGKIFATTDEWWEFGHMFTAVDTDRRSAVLDLGTDDGRDALWTLIERADFLVENFAPRVAERWGLTHEAVLQRNPDIVYVRMPAFGLDGPWRDRPAFAQTIEPMSTMSSITGFADGMPVSKGGLPDPVGGSTGAWATLVGHAQRLRTGRGVAVESVMLEAALNASAQPMLEHAATGIVMERTGNRSPHAAPQGVYPTSVDGQWLALSVTDDEQWRALATVLGAEGLVDDPRLATHAGRTAAQDDLDAIIAAWVVTHDAETAADLLCAAGVPAGACRDPRLLRHHPQYLGRRVFEDVDHPVVGVVAVPGQPHRSTGIDRWIGRAAPTFGQHTDEVLADAGMAPDRIADLRARDIITDRPRGM